MASTPNTQKKWEQLLQATLLENQSSFMEKLSADAAKANVGAFTKFAFPMIKKSYPKLVMSNIVSVQPMTSPIGSLALYKKWAPLLGDEDEEPPFKLDVPVSSLFTRKLKDGSERKIVGLITKISENKEAQPFAVVEDAATGESPDEAQFDDYKFGRDSSKPWNGFNQDKSRARDEEE